MNKEEITNRIQELIYTFDIEIKKHGGHDDLFELDKEALQGLLDLYKQEKEKNKKLFEEYNKRVGTIIKYEQKIKKIIDKIDVADYYCLNKAEEDLRKLVDYWD